MSSSASRWRARFVVEPPIVMADEPTGNLDSANGKLVLDLLLDRNRKAGTTLVLVTHDPEVASRADRKIVLRDGRVVEDSKPGTAAPGVQSMQGESTRARRAMARRALSWEQRGCNRLARSEVGSRQNLDLSCCLVARWRGSAGGRARAQRQLSPDAQHGGAFAARERSERAT